MKIAITSTYEISCAHQLPYHQGKCRNLHGHNYRIEFMRYGNVQEGTHSSAGMVEDFSDFDTPIKALIMGTLDHHSLNDILDNPTGENLGIYLLTHLPQVDKVTIWETSKHSVIVER